MYTTEPDDIMEILTPPVIRERRRTERRIVALGMFFTLNALIIVGTAAYITFLALGIRLHFVWLG